MHRPHLLSYAIIVLVVLSVPCQAGSATVQSYRQFQKGMTYAAWWHDTYLTTESDRSLEALAETGTNWVALIVTWYQDKYTDSSMKPDADRTPTDASLIHAIQMIHRLGMRIMLKPHVDLVESKHWRGEIDPTNETAWFDSYRTFITHYAELAQTNDVEMLSVGTELSSMTQRGYTAYWLAIIDDIRRVYEGELTYAANWWPDSAWQDLGFLKELNYLGIDAYFPLTEKEDPTISELKKAWQQWISQIENWENLSGKQIVLTEIGYRDLDGANIHPWDWQIEGSQDQQEQADCYQAALETFWGKAWLHGIFWWAWTYEQQLQDYTPWGKLAEGVLREWYAKPFIPEGTPLEAVPALVVIQKAENATATAIREGRTRGLDEAMDLLSQAMQAYDQRDLSRSEVLADSAARAADAAVSQREYDLAAAVVNEAYQKLSSLRNATLQSNDAIQLKRQSEAQYSSALEALNGNKFDLAKAHANNASALADEALAAEHEYEASKTSLTSVMAVQSSSLNLLYSMAAMGVVLVAISAIVTKKRRSRQE